MPLFTQYFKAKVGRCLLEYPISLVHMPHIPPGSLCCYKQEQKSWWLPWLSGRMVALPKCSKEIQSDACVDTKPRCIEVTCIVSGDIGGPRVSLYCKQQKALQWPTNEAAVIWSVHVYEHTRQHSVKYISRRHLLCMREKHLCKKWGVRKAFAKKQEQRRQW